MQRYNWLCEDALTRAPLPFIPHQTQLELLGFLLSGPYREPGPTEILAQSGGRRFIMAHDGTAREWKYYPRDEVRMPDIPAHGGTVCVGCCAYNLGDGRVVFGAPREVRRQLRRLMAGPNLTLSAKQMLAIDGYLLERAQAVLRARAFIQGSNPTTAHAVLAKKPDVSASLMPVQAAKVAVPQP